MSILLLIFFIELPITGLLASADSLGVQIAVIALAFLLFVGLSIFIFIPFGIIVDFGLCALVVNRDNASGSLGRGYDLFVDGLVKAFSSGSSDSVSLSWLVSRRLWSTPS